MKIFFDTRMINHPGIGRYIKCIVGQFNKRGDIELNLLGNKEDIEKHLGTTQNVINFTYPIYSTQEQFGFVRLKKTIGSDVLHVPHYNIPVLSKFNLAVTLHDLIHIVYPQGASKRFASTYMKFMVDRVLRSSKRVICVSESTKNSLEKIYGKKCSNINVIHEGIDEKFCRLDANYLSLVKEKYKLPEKFILYVGSIRRHKNIAMLLESFSTLKKKLNDVFLVVIGRHSQDFDFKKENVIYLGEMPDDKELVAVYNLASCFCNISLHEGFGLTILEAQSCKTPVVCSNIAPHLEIGANAILAVNPASVDQITYALYNVLTDNFLRNSLIEKGLENINRFNWADTADKTIAIYKELLKNG